MIRLPEQHRLAAAVLVLLALSGAPVRAADDGAAVVQRAAAAYASLEADEIAKLSQELDRLSVDPAVVEAFRGRDREKLLAVAQPKFAKLAKANITHWYFLDAEPARTCFLRVHAPTLHGDVVARETFSQAIATGKMGAGKELGKTAFALRVVKPVRFQGKLLGYMELGEEIDHFLERMKAQTGDDYGVLVDKALVDRRELARVRGEDRWEERPDVVLVDATMWNDRNIDLGMPLAKLPAAGTFMRGWKDGDRSYVGGAFPVRDASSRVVGALFVRHAVSP